MKETTENGNGAISRHVLCVSVGKGRSNRLCYHLSRSLVAHTFV